ncbi:MAG: 50S ribosomal protein L10 [Alphaproteobacteria bacterium]
MNREEKKELVAELKGLFDEASTVVVTHYKGLTVTDMNDLRRKISKAGADFRVTKNRLTRLALAGTKFDGLADLFEGPTAIAYAKDPVAAAKPVVDFAKGNKSLIVLGAAMDGQTLSEDQVKTLAALPSLDELRSKIIAVLQTPATRLACVTQAPAAQLARVCDAYAKKG